jgi:hypothetical protein
MRKVSDNICRKIKIHVLRSINFFLKKSCRLLDNSGGKKCVESDRPQKTIRLVRNACWIPKATDRHSEYVIRIAFSLQQQFHGQASTLRYTYTACLINAKC